MLDPVSSFASAPNHSRLIYTLTLWAELYPPETLALAIPNAAITNPNPSNPLTTPCTGNHHLFSVRPLAILGTRIPEGKSTIVATAPHAT